MWKVLAKGLTLHDFCHATDQIGYDMKRRVIAEDCGFCLRIGDPCDPPFYTTRLTSRDCVFL